MQVELLIHEKTKLESMKKMRNALNDYISIIEGATGNEVDKRQQLKEAEEMINYFVRQIKAAL